MKAKLILLLLLLAAFTASADDRMRDGTDWQSMPRADRSAWVIGWMDGLATGQLLAIKGNISPQYNKQIEQFTGLQMPEIVQGLDQFYEADYRNLKISIGWAALFVTRYRNGMSTADAKAEIELMRDASHR